MIIGLSVDGMTKSVGPDQTAPMEQFEQGLHYLFWLSIQIIRVNILT